MESHKQTIVLKKTVIKDLECVTRKFNFCGSLWKETLSFTLRLPKFIGLGRAQEFSSFPSHALAL